MIYVYIIKCNGSIYYTGITNNLRRRFYEHARGSSRFTSRFSYFCIVYFDFFIDRHIARQIEVYIKKIGAKKFLQHHTCNL
jgi:putative endonuclease